MTIGLLKAAEEMGLKCPDDFGLVSFDDYPWLGVCRPRLTTVELPKHQLGSDAAELLVQRIEGGHQHARAEKAATRTSHPRILRFWFVCFRRAAQLETARAGAAQIDLRSRTRFRQGDIRLRARSH
jgi:hypothetical protein